MTITEFELDELIVNLKVLGNLQKNTKIITKDKFLNIENSTFIPESIKRWIRGDNRDEIIKKIDIIVSKAISYQDEKKELTPYIQKSLSGIINLKETYSTCQLTIARLDTLIDKINKNIKDT